MTDPEIEIKALRNELLEAKSAVQRAEADRDARVLAVKKQLQDAKEKAKTLFQTKVGHLTAQVKEFEEAARLKQEENDQLKQLLRSSDEATCKEVAKAVQEISGELNREQTRVTKQQAEIEQLSSALALAEKTKTDSFTEWNAEKTFYCSKIAQLEAQLIAEAAPHTKNTAIQNESLVRDCSDDSQSALVSNNDGFSEEHRETSGSENSNDPPKSVYSERCSVLQNSLELAQVRISELEDELSRQTRMCQCSTIDGPIEEGKTSKTGFVRNPESSLVSSDEQPCSLAAENKQKRRDEGSCNNCIDRDQKIQEMENLCRALQAELASAKAKNTADAPTTTGNPSAASQSITTENSVAEHCENCREKDVRLVELERMVSTKQSEISKVREKARTYLKDLNAEKRDLEVKLRDEITRLNDKLNLESAKLFSSEQEIERVSKEIEGCLDIISEKQKTIQSLTMAVNSERDSLREARREFARRNDEFERYKERARIALQDKDAAICAAENNVHSATEALRETFAVRDREYGEVVEQLEAANKRISELSEAAERAARAETALEAARQNTDSASSIQINRIKGLESELDSAREEAEAKREAVVDAEARYQSLLRRFEASEQSLRSAEKEFGERSKMLTDSASELKERIVCLEDSLRQSKEASTAAQRTAAAAARALQWNSGERNNSLEEGGSSRDRSPTKSRMPDSNMLSDAVYQLAVHNLGDHRHSRNDTDDSVERLQKLSLLAEGEAVDSSSDALAVRDQQIAVLTSQIAELGLQLNDLQEELQLREEQAKLLKAEVHELQGNLSAAEKLSNSTPFSYMRAIVLRYIETKDTALLPVVADVLSLSGSDKARLCNSTASNQSDDSYFTSLSFLRPTKKS